MVAYAPLDLDDAGLALIAHFEGCVLQEYLDTRGLRTIGFGHLCKPEESFQNGITYAQATEMLHTDSASKVAAIKALVKVPLSQHEFDALCSLAFNIGVGGLSSSTVLRLLNQGDKQGAAEAFLMWCKASTPTELLGRRKEEEAFFLTPDA